MVIVHSQATLLAEPHVGYGIFIKRPATRVDHERDHEQVNDPMNQSIHVLSLKGILLS